MKLQILSKDGLQEWITLLLEDYRVVEPRRRPDPVFVSRNGHRKPDDQFLFDELHEARELELDYPSTVLPPKKWLLPQQETLFSFREGGQEIELALDQRPTVIFGIHTCDLQAILLLDQVFSGNLPDPHYLARRANTLLVSIECLEPCMPSAFCKDMGTWLPPESFDLHLTDLGQVYAVEMGSDRGAELLATAPGLRAAGARDQRALARVRQAKWPRFSHRLELAAAELPGLLAASGRSRTWEELGQKCLSCGSCTAVCPTCFCFDVQDSINFDLSSGQRMRVWDSCQFSEFATVAGGHDFRPSRAARLRHRFNHKYRYLPQNSGFAGCVGCGRCAAACLVKIDPIAVLNDLQRKRAAAGKHMEVRR